jgi:hypothetical protein
MKINQEEFSKNKKKKEKLETSRSMLSLGYKLLL